MKGRVHVYYGKGVGKTTRVIGLAIRAAGAGKKVFFLQFLKDGNSSEVEILEDLSNIDYRSTGTLGFIFDRQPSEKEREIAKNGIKACEDAINEKYDIIIADEILNALGLGLIDEKDIMGLVKATSEDMDIILTGRPCSKNLIEISDYATEFKMIKHPYQRGVEAKKGVDY